MSDPCTKRPFVELRRSNTGQVHYRSMHTLEKSEMNQKTRYLGIEAVSPRLPVCGKTAEQKCKVKSGPVLPTGI